MAIGQLPGDVNMLLSFVNTRLRDEQINLESFCAQFDVSVQDLQEKLSEIDYHYNEELNRFV
ncbi:MAG: DUF4250 domain-containing protein [Wujia sp.]